MTDDEFDVPLRCLREALLSVYEVVLISFIEDYLIRIEECTAAPHLPHHRDTGLYHGGSTESDGYEVAKLASRVHVTRWCSPVEGPTARTNVTGMSRLAQFGETEDMKAGQFPADLRAAATTLVDRDCPRPAMVSGDSSCCQPGQPAIVLGADRISGYVKLGGDVARYANRLPTASEPNPRGSCESDTAPDGRIIRRLIGRRRIEHDEENLGPGLPATPIRRIGSNDMGQTERRIACPASRIGALKSNGAAVRSSSSASCTIQLRGPDSGGAGRIDFV